MAWNLSLSMGATLLALAGVHYSTQQQNVIIDTTSTQSSDGVLVAASAPQKRVSCHLQNANVAQVLHVLEREGVSFVVKDSDVKERTVTLNIVEQPLDQVIDALGNAIGGHWERNGNIRIFAPSTVSRFNFNYAPRALTPFGQQPFLIQPAPKFADPSFGKSSDPFLNKQRTFLFMPNKAGEAPKVWAKGFGYNDLKGATPFFVAPLGRNKQDWPGFMKSLTSEERATLKQQGYLKPSDLTPSQRRMIGLDQMKGTFELQYKSDKDSVVIKSG